MPAANPIKKSAYFSSADEYPSKELINSFLLIFMEYYYVNKNAQLTGEHEVHKSTCSYLPDSSNLIQLGIFSNCADAVKKAKEYYNNVDGCYYCCNACHKR